MRLLIAGALLTAALPALSSPFGDRYPAGSIKEPAQAEQALRDANAEAERIERESRSREAECLKGFLVNRCRESARRDRLEAERELRRVRVEAHDLQRRVQAQEDARKRAAAAPEPAAPREPRAVRTPDAPKREGPARPGITAEEAARNREAYDKRVAEKQGEAASEAARAPERAENARAYHEKQTEAAERARQKEAERKQNEERRAERRKQIEAQEAQRAEVRRKAEEAKAAAKP